MLTIKVYLASLVHHASITYIFSTTQNFGYTVARIMVDAEIKCRKVIKSASVMPVTVCAQEGLVVAPLQLQVMGIEPMTPRLPSQVPMQQ